MPQEPLNLEVEGELQLKSPAKSLEPASEAAEPHRSEGGELFIVDNSDSEWKGLKYLQDWTEIASAFDIASGFFEIGSLLALDGRWQQLEKIRVLLGAEMSARTRQALLEGLKQRTEQILDQSIEEQKEQNDFLNGVPAIVDGVRSGKSIWMSVKADTWPDEMKTRGFDILVARCTRILGSSAANKEFLPLRS